MDRQGWNFESSVTDKTKLKQLCLEVEQHFPIPTKRLCRYIDGTEDALLRLILGEHYRGFYAPLSERRILPEHIRRCLFYPQDDFAEVMPFLEMVAFDSLIYVRGSTCSDLTGFVANYAHEFQHFVQDCQTPRLLWVNNVLRQKLKSFESDAVTIHLPHEQDAEIKSKRVAEKLCGEKAVQMFAEKQVGLMAGEHEQRAKWVFFRDTPSSTDYDLLSATIPFVERYKDKIDFRIDVNQPEWWIGPLKGDEQDD